jgi:membrane associated rhomboid family serine protease
MYTSSYDPKNQPLFHFKGYPVRLAMLLVVIHVAAMVIESIAGSESYLFLALRGSRAMSPLGEIILWPEWWQWGTYILGHVPSIWFLLDMFYLWRFGSELETIFGRRLLGILYAVLIAIPSVVGAAAFGSGMVESFAFFGTRYSHLCLFLGFVFIHPNVSFFNTPIRAWHLGLIFFLLYFLQDISMRNMVGATALVCNAGATYVIMRRAGLTPRFTRVAEAFSSALPRPGRKKEPKALPYEAKMQPRLDVREDRRAVEKIDAILEKISLTGIESLDEWERRELERASKELKRQDS